MRRVRDCFARVSGSVLTGAFVLLLAATRTVPAQTAIPRAVMQQLSNQLRSDVPAIRECTSKSDFPFSARAVDLNGDDHSEYLLTSANDCECGQVNCTHWVYRAHDQTFELLLEANGYVLTAASTSHQGYRDLKTTSRNNAVSVDHVLYAFNGTRYQRRRSTIENLDTHEIKPTQQRLRFARGASSATVSGAAALAFPDSWTFEARRGQLVTLSLQHTSGANASFTVVGPDTDGARVLTDLQIRWSNRLPADGQYTILVDAKGDGRAKYALTVEIR